MSPDFVDCCLTIGGKPCIAFYSRSSHKIMLCNSMEFENGLNAPFLDLSYTLHYGWYVEPIYVDGLSKDSTRLATWQQHIEGDYANAGPDDNPSLIFY